MCSNISPLLPIQCHRLRGSMTMFGCKRIPRLASSARILAMLRVSYQVYLVSHDASDFIEMQGDARQFHCAGALRKDQDPVHVVGQVYSWICALHQVCAAMENSGKQTQRGDWIKRTLGCLWKPLRRPSEKKITSFRTSRTSPRSHSGIGICRKSSLSKLIPSKIVTSLR